MWTPRGTLVLLGLVAIAGVGAVVRLADIIWIRAPGDAPFAVLAFIVAGLIVGTIAWIGARVRAEHLVVGPETIGVDERRGLRRHRETLLCVQGSCVASLPTGAIASVLLDTTERIVRFGRGLDPESAERIARYIRAACFGESPGDDGVLRPVASIDGWHGSPWATPATVLSDRRAVRGNVDRIGWSSGARQLGLFMACMIASSVLPAIVPIASAVASTVLVVALFVTFYGLEAVQAGRWSRRLRAAGDTPWTAARCWRDSVLPRRPASRAIVPGALFVALVLAAAWSAAEIESTGAAAYLWGCGAGAIGALWWMQNVFFAGTTEVRLRKMPYFLGEPVDIDFAVARSGAPFESIAFELRRLVERDGQVLASHVARREFPPDRPPPGPGDQVECTLDVPEDAGGCVLEASACVIWELTVRGETSRGTYVERFPLPVFDRCSFEGGGFEEAPFEEDATREQVTHE